VLNREKATGWRRRPCLLLDLLLAHDRLILD
jgi:hypothetical protein